MDEDADGKTYLKVVEELEELQEKFENLTDDHCALEERCDELETCLNAAREALDDIRIAATTGVSDSRPPRH